MERNSALPSLHWKRGYLEELDLEKHLAGVHAMWSDPLNLRDVGVSPPKFLEETRELLSRRVRASNPAIENFAIFSNDEISKAVLSSNVPDTSKSVDSYADAYPAPPPHSEEPSVGSPGTTLPTDTADHLASASPPANSSTASVPSRSGSGSGGMLIGLVGTPRTSPPELGYGLHCSYWGRGLATEAVSVFLRYYWEKRPEVPFVDAYVRVGHKSSERVLQKTGFARVEIVPAGEKLPSGQIVGKEWGTVEGEENLGCGVWRLPRPTAD